jgi:hypothetical protein
MHTESNVALEHIDKTLIFNDKNDYLRRMFWSGKKRKKIKTASSGFDRKEDPGKQEREHISSYSSGQEGKVWHSRSFPEEIQGSAAAEAPSYYQTLLDLSLIHI